jgi:hypothetical protein
MKKQIQFPLVIKKKGVPFIEPQASVYHILAADGFYVVKKNTMYETCTKVDYDIPGYEPQEEYCKTHMPIIPNEIMDQAMSFFRTVYDDLGGEAIVELFYNEDSREWLAIPPYQGIPVSGSKKVGGFRAGIGVMTGGMYPGYEDDYEYATGKGGAGITSAYGTCFEEHATVITGETEYEIYDYNLKKYVPCKKGTKGAYKVSGSGGFGWAHDLVYAPSVSTVWPEGYRRIGTIHSHPYSDAYFSATDNADDKYGDGMHLVFGFINDANVNLKKNVKASFCSNGQRFTWDKKDNEEVMEPFIDADTQFPPEWLGRCHEVKKVSIEGGQEQYVSTQPKPPKAISAPKAQPKPVKNGKHKVASLSNIRRAKKGAV